MSDVFELVIDGKRYRLLCQERNDSDFSDVAWSSCPVPQGIIDAINESGIAWEGNDEREETC